MEDLTSGTENVKGLNTISLQASKKVEAWTILQLQSLSPQLEKQHATGEGQRSSVDWRKMYANLEDEFCREFLQRGLAILMLQAAVARRGARTAGFFHGMVGEEVVGFCIVVWESAVASTTFEEMRQKSDHGRGRMPLGRKRGGGRERKRTGHWSQGSWSSTKEPKARRHKRNFSRASATLLLPGL